MPQLLSVLMDQVRGTLDLVYRGLTPEPGPGETAGWLPHDNLDLKDSLGIED